MTPDEWLLERFDKRLDYPHSRPWGRRRMFQILDDHPSPECEEWGSCFAGEAAWPIPHPGQRLSPSGSTTYRELIEGEAA